ncbi:exosome nuclease subunit [Rhizina undulata]
MDAGSFKPLQDSIFDSLLSTVKTASALASTDISFQRSSDRKFASSLDTVNARILGIANALIKSAATNSDIQAPKLNDADDVETSWGEIVEVVDYMLEKADTCLDEYTGAIKQKNPEPLPGARIYSPRPAPKVQKSTSWKSRKMVKPQLSFAVKPDNYDTSPFKPLLTKKPHATVTLEESLKTYVNEEGKLQYIHPYATEIAALAYPRQMFAKKEPTPYLSFENTQAELVDTPEALAAMLSELKKAGEIAVDLEHHDSHSYIGFVCLMQISTRWKDWIVDTLKLRRELEVLNEVFADPGIIKVLHGANMDIIWLQRDFGLYLVGLFDTHHAAMALGFPGLGLAYLLKKYVDFDADKQYQLADWRIRPLPQEMLDYARSDTHFLLYIFDHLRNELLTRTPTPYNSDVSTWNPETSKVHRVLTDSKEVALRRYEREVYDPINGTGALGWRAHLYRNEDSLNGVQTVVFKAVHQWRDQLARQEDEGLHFIMPRHQLFNLARRMPVDVAEILNCCHGISPPVRLRASELAGIIRTAKESLAAEEAMNKMVVQPLETIAPVQEVVERVKTEGTINVFEPQQSHLVASKSAFWGNAFGSSRWQEESLKEGLTEAVRFAIPLPQLTAEVYVSEDHPREEEKLEEKKIDPGARAEHEFVKNRPAVEKDDVLIVKTLGGGRKRKFDDDPSSTATTASGEPSGVSEPAEKQKKKKKKKKVKAEVADESENTQVEEEGKPFDYKNAQKIFNAPKAGARKDEASGGGKKRKKAFNPYKGMEDAPKGMGRVQREREGKGGTFRK